MKKKSGYLGKGMKTLSAFLGEHYKYPGRKPQSQAKLKAIVSQCKKELAEHIRSSDELFVLMYQKDMFEFFLKEIRKNTPTEMELAQLMESAQPVLKLTGTPGFRELISKNKKNLRELESALEKLRLEFSILEALNELQSYLDDQCKEMARNFVSDLRTPPLDERVEYSWKYMFLQMLKQEPPVEAQADLKAVEKILIFEEWAFRNFTKEIEDNFLGLNSDAAKEYIEQLSLLMADVETVFMDDEHFKTPPESSPFWFASCQINQRRKDQRREFFRELEQQFEELQELQKKTRFTFDLKDCMPKTDREKFILRWEMGELKETDQLFLEATLPDTEGKDLKRLLRILEDPDLWGTAEYEAVNRIRDLKRRKAFYKRKPVNLLSYNIG